MQDGWRAKKSFPFSQRERERLTAYRAAIRAGLYSDEAADASDHRPRRLPEPPVGADLFTRAELERLASYRDAVRAGLFADRQAGAPPA